MTHYLVMGSNSLTGDNHVVLCGYEDNIFFIYFFFFLDFAIIAASNNL